MISIVDRDYKSTCNVWGDHLAIYSHDIPMVFQTLQHVSARPIRTSNGRRAISPWGSLGRTVRDRSRGFCMAMVVAVAVGSGSWLKLLLKTGGWFETCCIFPYIGNLIIPIDELIFFRGAETTNQKILNPNSVITHYPRGVSSCF